MSDESSRKALHAYVTDGAHDQWHGFAAEQGVSVSAILEALAPTLTVNDERAEYVNVLEVITEARRIDARRRRRRR
ncbi:MAG: hypothetical protein HKN03_02785 [Acidimicrobiales bacterium]|nr:hypothetical protein [Acidimicrobiales bacterium]